jgi:hypothetical protein
MAALEIVVKNNEELHQIMEQGNYKISSSVVNNILNHLNDNKKYIHVLTVICEDENTQYDLTIERKNFIDTLEKNLKIFEQYEDFDGCVLIQKAIQQLKS